MEVSDIYHGAAGDNILQIIREGKMRPGADGKVFFSEWSYEPAFQHGGDSKRRAAFAFKLRATIPADATLQRTATQGVPQTLTVLTKLPFPVEVIELYIRLTKASAVQRIKGSDAISTYLSR